LSQASENPQDTKPRLHIFHDLAHLPRRFFYFLPGHVPGRADDEETLRFVGFD